MNKGVHSRYIYQSLKKQKTSRNYFLREKTPQRNERILFVDDEELLVQATTKILAHQGCENFLRRPQV
ncbi:MAG: hypothetical protein L3J57_09480 [Desulfuromusa sp.]|nr:hypothetical protein [Desulfuromusa sp.]